MTKARGKTFGTTFQQQYARWIIHVSMKIGNRETEWIGNLVVEDGIINKKLVESSMMPKMFNTRREARKFVKEAKAWIILNHPREYFSLILTPGKVTVRMI